MLKEAPCLVIGYPLSLFYSKGELYHFYDQMCFDVLSFLIY